MAQHPVNREICPPVDGIEITPGTPFDPCSAINCWTTAGVGTVTWLNGRTSRVYFNLGSNPMQITNISASGLAAAGLTAVYNK